MAHRYYVCPIVQDPSDVSNKIAKVMLYPHVATSGVNQLGTNWCLIRVEASSFAAIDADPECRDVFEALADASNTSKANLIAWLKTNTLGSLQAPRRNSIQNRLTTLGVDLTGISNASSLWDVVVRAHRLHVGHDRLEDI